MDRSLPSDSDAERATLGAILLNRDAILAIDGWLLPEHFYAEKHAWIYEAALTCHHQRTPPDLTTISNELRRRERLEDIGGLVGLLDLANSTPTSVHIEHYARIVQQTAVLRRLISAGGTIVALGFDERDNLDATLAKAELALTSVAETAHNDGFLHIGLVADAYWQRLGEVRDNPDSISGVQTGFRDLDDVTGGLQRSDLIILAARPAVGKTSLALSIADGVARRGGRVGVASLEMSREQLLQRLIALHTGVDVQRLRTGRLGQEGLGSVAEALGQIAALPLWIDDRAAISMRSLAANARREHARDPLALLVVDYLQLMDGPGENRVQVVGAISRGLKQLARELNIPIIALSQLSRAVESRASQIPMLSDLRESGNLEQDADLVWFIYREELYDRDTENKGIAEIHIAKHRNGPTAVVPLRFDASTTRFSGLERYHTPEGY
jgi:replicative DNA helicase